MQQFLFDHLDALKVTTLVILALINFAFVKGIDFYIHHSNVKFIYTTKATQSQILREIKNSLLTTPVHAILLLAFVLSGWLKTQETIISFIYTLVIVFLWTEVWHYSSHIAMHTRFLHFIHREHHKSMITNPWTSISFSLTEKFIFSLGILGFAALVSQIVPMSFYGISAYYLLYFYTNTLGHSNFEIREPDYYNTRLGKVFNTPSYHALHHARYIKNYGLLTPWLDKLFNTYWDDYIEVQTRAANNLPMTRINERPKFTDTLDRQ